MGIDLMSEVVLQFYPADLCPSLLLDQSAERLRLASGGNTPPGRLASVKVSVDILAASITLS